MEHKEISVEEGNRLIAEFMGYGFNETKKDGAPFYKEIQKHGWISKSYYSLPFHSSWNLLMPVVEKANKVNEEMQKKVTRHDWDDGEDKNLDDPTGWRAWSYRYVKLSTSINSVWSSVVQFIIWYNTHSKQ